MSKSTTGGISTLWVVYGIIGYFVYDSIAGALGIMLYSFVFGILAMAGLIPVLGQIIYYAVGTIFIEPFIFNFTGIYSTLLTSFIFWFQFAISCLISIFVLAAVVLK